MEAAESCYCGGLRGVRAAQKTSRPVAGTSMPTRDVSHGEETLCVNQDYGEAGVSGNGGLPTGQRHSTGAWCFEHWVGKRLPWECTPSPHLGLESEVIPPVWHRSCTQSRRWKLDLGPVQMQEFLRNKTEQPQLERCS